MPFSFQQFHIDDLDCGMPVSTDGVLLGAWAQLPSSGRILDIGAGSGLLSLMAAQSCRAQVLAIEIDAAAARACRNNFSASPWHDRLTLLEADMRQLDPQQSPLAGGFDHILCNPPYFESGPQSQKPGRAQARHSDSLSFAELLHIIAKLLRPDSRASLVIPTQAEASLLQAAKQNGLNLSRRTLVSSTPGKAANRLLLELSQGAQPLEQHTLCLRNQEGHYSPEMVALTRDFYLKL